MHRPSLTDDPLAEAWEQTPMPSGRAFVIAFLVVFCALLILGMAACLIWESSFWEVAPEILKRALRL